MSTHLISLKVDIIKTSPNIFMYLREKNIFITALEAWLRFGFSFYWGIKNSGVSGTNALIIYFVNLAYFKYIAIYIH